MDAVAVCWVIVYCDEGQRGGRELWQCGWSGARSNREHHSEMEGLVRWCVCVCVGGETVVVD